MKKLIFLSVALFALSAAGASVVYPADGNIDFEEGTLELLLSADFDPAVPPKNGKMEMPATVFQMDFPGDAHNNYFALKFWNRIMNDGKHLAELRISLWVKGKGQGGPSIPVGSWKKGEFHHIAFAWKRGEMIMYCDGQQTWKGKMVLPLDMDLKQVWLLVGSRALWWAKSSYRKRESFLPEESNRICVAAIRISADSRQPGKEFDFKPDKLTLLLDQYRDLKPDGTFTRPEIISDKGFKQGRIVGRFAVDEKGIYLYPKKDLKK